MPISWRARLIAAILAGGPSSLASHRAAARLWKLDGVTERVIEISVGAGRRISGATVHRLRGPSPAIVIIDSIPVTGIRRTLLDLAAVVETRPLGLALDDALRRGITTLRELREEVSAHGPKRGTRALRKMLEERDRSHEKAQSALETAFLRLVRRHNLPAPVPQYEIALREQTIARLDFAYPLLRIGVELDGYRWHSGLERWEADLRRENRLKLLGWKILRFTWDDVHKRPQLVAGDVREALGLQTLELSR